jgi:hypothetical protein
MISEEIHRFSPRVNSKLKHKYWTAKTPWKLRIKMLGKF